MFSSRLVLDFWKLIILERSPQTLAGETVTRYRPFTLVTRYKSSCLWPETALALTFPDRALSQMSILPSCQLSPLEKGRDPRCFTLTRTFLTPWVRFVNRVPAVLEFSGAPQPPLQPLLVDDDMFHSFSWPWESLGMWCHSLEKCHTANLKGGRGGERYYKTYSNSVKMT